MIPKSAVNFVPSIYHFLFVHFVFVYVTRRIRQVAFIVNMSTFCIFILNKNKKTQIPKFRFEKKEYFESGATLSSKCWCIFYFLYLYLLSQSKIKQLTDICYSIKCFTRRNQGMVPSLSAKFQGMCKSASTFDISNIVCLASDNYLHYMNLQQFCVSVLTSWYQLVFFYLED